MTAKRKRLIIPTSVCLLIGGSAVGWLTGLSASPVLYILITSIVALIVSITSALAGLTSEENEDSTQKSGSRRKLHFGVDPFPVMMMIFGLALGASFGVYARAHNWLGIKTANFVSQWKSTGLSDEEISKRLFDGLYPPPPQSLEIDKHNGSTVSSNDADGQKPADETQKTEIKKAQAAERPSPFYITRGVLFTATSKECDMFRTASDERLKDFLMVYRYAPVRKRAENCANAECLRKIVEELCP